MRPFIFSDGVLKHDTVDMNFVPPYLRSDQALNVLASVYSVLLIQSHTPVWMLEVV